MFTVTTTTVYTSQQGTKDQEVSTYEEGRGPGDKMLEGPAQVKTDDMRSAWDDSGKPMFWAILAGVLGWVFIEVGRLMVQVHAKKMDTGVQVNAKMGTGVKMHRITTAGRVAERKAEVKVAKLEVQRAKMQEVKKRVAEESKNQRWQQNRWKRRFDGGDWVGEGIVGG